MKPIYEKYYVTPRTGSYATDLLKAAAYYTICFCIYVLVVWVAQLFVTPFLTWLCGQIVHPFTPSVGLGIDLADYFSQLFTLIGTFVDGLNIWTVPFKFIQLVIDTEIWWIEYFIF